MRRFEMMFSSRIATVLLVLLISLSLFLAQPSLRHESHNSVHIHRELQKGANSQTAIELRVLLFGDSLTEGYYDHGTKFHPYAIKLNELLVSTFAQSTTSTNKVYSDVSVVVDQLGLSGETTEHMTVRLSGILHKANNATYDIACILGGTNDLGLFRHLKKTNPAKEIFGNLQKLCTLLRKSNPHMHIVLLTVPQSYVRDTEYIAVRSELNTLIKEYVAKEKHMTVVDIEKLIPYYNTQGIVDNEYWNDRLHFSPKGYDKVGEIIFDATVNDVKTIVAKKLAVVRK